MGEAWGICPISAELDAILELRSLAEQEEGRELFPRRVRLDYEKISCVDILHSWLGEEKDAEIVGCRTLFPFAHPDGKL